VKVLHLLPTFDLGGLGSLALELIGAWAEEDRHVVLASRFPGTKPQLRRDFESRLGGSVLDVPRNLLHPMGFVDSLRDTARRFGPYDAAVIYNFFDHVWYTMAVRRAGFNGPILCHVGTRVPDSTVVTKMLGSPFTTEVRFVPASTAVRDRLVEVGCEPGLVTDTVWNGVDLTVFKPALRAEGAEGSPLRVGFVGRMAPEAKDFDGLIRGWALVPEPVRGSARLVLAGDGPLRRRFEQLADTLGVRDSVEFLGAVARADMPGFLNSLGLFVMAALPIEGMSMALVEAFASGLPVLASDVPANREVVTAAGAGHLVAQSAEGYARGIEWMLRDPNARAVQTLKSCDAAPLFDIRRTAETYRRWLAR